MANDKKFSTNDLKSLESSRKLKKAIEEKLDSDIRYNELLAERGRIESEINKEAYDAIQRRNSLENEMKASQSFISKLLLEKNEILLKGNKASDYQKARLIAIVDLLKEQNKTLLVSNNEYNILEKSLKAQGFSIDDLIEKTNRLNEIASERKDIEKKIIETTKEQRKEAEASFKSYDKFFNRIDQTTSFVKGIVSASYDLIKPWTAIDNAASSYSKSIGLSGIGYEKVRRNIIALADSQYKLGGTISSTFNVSGEELLKLQQGYSEALGRNVVLTRDASIDMIAMRNVLGEDVTSDITSKFEQFGISVIDVGQKMSDLINKTGKQGIVAGQAAKLISQNIEIAQDYKFKDGIDGLIKMAENSAKLRLNMQSVAQFADKVSTIEGSITTSANLQVLGGSFTNFSDPMGMLYESLNDINGLQDRMSNMFSKLGKFDTKKGEVDISAFNRIRMKAASEAMGVSYSDMVKTTQTQAKREEIQKKLSPEVQKNEDLKEMILNTAFWDKKKGTFAVSINGQSKGVNELGAKDYDDIKALTKDQGQNIQDIAIQLRSWDEAITGVKKGIESKQANWLESIAESGKNMITGVLNSNKNLNAILIAIGVGKAYGGIKSAYGNYRNNKLNNFGENINSGNGKGNFVKGMGKGVGKIFPKGMTPLKAGGLAAGGLAVEMGTQAIRQYTKPGSTTDISTATIGGAVSGGLTGSIFGPWGTAIGAAIGGGLGYWNATHNKATENNNSESGEQRTEYGRGGVLIGPSHNNGGMPIKNSKISVEGGEFVVNKNATMKNMELLTKINTGSNIKPNESFGRTSIVSNNIKTTTLNDNISVNPINLNLNGNIKLDSGNGKTADISPDILKDQTFLRELATMISKEMNIKANGAFNKKNFRETWI